MLCSFDTSTEASAPVVHAFILFMDGHTCPDTVAFAVENGIILFLLPPNTTHLTKPRSVQTTLEQLETLKLPTQGKSLVTSKT